MKNNKRYPVKIKSRAGLALYKNNPYVYKKICTFTKTVKKITAFIGIGVIVFYGSNLMIDKNPASAEIDNKIKVDNIVDENINDEDNSVDDTLVTEEKSQDVVFDVGSNDDKSYVASFLNSEAGSYVYKYSEMYGVDPNLIASMCMQESSLEHYECLPECNGISEGSMYNGYGVGIMQLECPNNQEITCYNYCENDWETDYITMDNACNLETNIKLGCMIFQNSLRNNNGNILMAIQSHNYGQGMMDCLLYDAYGDDYNIKKLEYSNTDWIEYVKKAHLNPQIYVPNWDESTYGDDEYITHVLSHCPEKLVKYKFGAYEYTFDLSTLKTVKMDEYSTKIK